MLGVCVDGNLPLVYRKKVAQCLRGTLLLLGSLEIVLV